MSVISSWDVLWSFFENDYPKFFPALKVSKSTIDTVANGDNVCLLYKHFQPFGCITVNCVKIDGEIILHVRNVQTIEHNDATQKTVFNLRKLVRILSWWPHLQQVFPRCKNAECCAQSNMFMGFNEHAISLELAENVKRIWTWNQTVTLCDLRRMISVLIFALGW